MKCFSYILLIYFFLCRHSYTIAQTDAFLQKLLEKEPEKYSTFLADTSKYKIQILYTKIHRNGKNEPKLTTYRYRVNDNAYFYPASTVKLMVAALALEKINLLNIKGLHKFTPMLTDANHPAQSAVHTDSTAENQLPSIAHYIRKILLASDNDAYNRLYEFLGQDYIQQKLQEKGFHQTRILHRLGVSMSTEENRYTNPIRFVDQQRIIYRQEGRKAIGTFPQSPVLLGKAYYQNDTLIRQPMNFSHKNRFSLTDQHTLMKALFFPEQVPATTRFSLTTDDYQFLYQYMSQLPIETTFPAHYREELYDAHTKFLLFGGTEKRVPRHIRVFNKSGNAYGFLVDNAYIADFERGIEFLVSAVIYCNNDEILNDDVYEYTTIGKPFFENLGKTLLHYEVQRGRKRRPNLDLYEVDYDN